ncbi:MAG: sialate O-acetylesterase [Flavobacterium sp.]|nr:sialate O-acetylesterase [Flavobacterium sp.]
MKKQFAAACLLAIASIFSVKAQIKLPAIIRDSMILQRNAKVNIWGWASANEKITVNINGKKITTKANDAGNWKAVLPPTKAGGPYTIELVGKNKITISNVLFGDVWFCSGQSNMVHQLNIHDVIYAKEIAEANFTEIRQFLIPNIANMRGPQKDLQTGNWQPAVGEAVRPFSAVAYFFAKKIYQEFRVPIGIINASVGGTPIEAWISEEGLKDFSAIATIIKKNKDTTNSLRIRSSNFSDGPKPLTDLGLAEAKKWFDITYQPKGWRSINIPGYWEDQGLKDLNGTVWYRKEITLPASFTIKQAKVFLGRIVDADELYINGKQVGVTTYQYPQRRYFIPAGTLKAGKNLFVIRVTNTSGKGGFVTDKPYCIFTDTDTVDLKGTWQYKVGEAYQPIARGNEGFAGGGAVNPQNQPTALYNGMVAPETNYTIKGFCWYQGESNVANAKEYANLLPALINDWRSKWQQDTLPYLFVQLPNYMDYNYVPSESGWALMREAQLKALSVPNTAMAVTIELGEWNDIHPDRKQEVGERLALAALKLAYNKNIVYSGPIFQSATIEGNKITLSFNHIGSGLTTNNDEAPAEFAIASADKRFVWAKAKIEGDKIIVWNDNVPNPLYVRYAWADNPVNPNLVNKEGLPAAPFRTDK